MALRCRLPRFHRVDLTAGQMWSILTTQRRKVSLSSEKLSGEKDSASPILREPIPAIDSTDCEDAL
jgi:hypothetical protein